MHICRNTHDLQVSIEAERKKRKNDNAIVGFVPTMGALHEGHLSLIELAKTQSDITIASIYVNPTQFAANEDFGTYPRDEEKDLSLLASKQTNIVFLPTTEDIYGDDVETITFESPLASILEGEHRPHFFHGVTTIVSKLFDAVKPDIAIFGEKDYQQLCIIKELVKQQNRSINIIGAPIARNSEGLALSSRNQYLSETESLIAPKLYQLITAAKTQLEKGASAQTTTSWVASELLNAGFRDVDYIAIRDAETLDYISNPKQNLRILAAAWLGKTRLIDNV